MREGTTLEMKQRDEDASAQREKDDLLAQQSVAKSTEYLVFLTLAQVILGVVGTAALAVTLYLNAQATKAAVLTARSERAWIISDGFDSGTLEGSVDGVPTKNGFIIQVKWRNAGRSPSLNTQCYSDIRLISPGENIPDFKASLDGSELKQAAVGPGIGFHGNPMALNDERAALFRSGKLRLIVYSITSYGDIFQPHGTRSSEICAEVEVNGEKIVNGKKELNISFRPIGPQNSLS